MLKGQRIKERAHRALDWLEQLEYRRHRSSTAAEHALFVLGLPRSGTTLVYQALAHSLSWSYFCSLAETRPRWPLLATRMASRSMRSYRSSFRSEHGFTERHAGPAEARDLWAQWLGWERDEPSQGPQAERRMRTTVHAVSHIVGAPFLGKNPDHCLHLPVLTRVFPRALFVRVSRQRLAVARSIARARLSMDSDWFGAKPPGWRDAKQGSLIQQVLFQIASLEQLLARDLERLVEPERVIPIDYDEFCAAPPTTLRRVAALMGRHGLPVRQRAELPGRFECSAGQPLPERLEAELLDRGARH